MGLHLSWIHKPFLKEITMNPIKLNRKDSTVIWLYRFGWGFMLAGVFQTLRLYAQLTAPVLPSEDVLGQLVSWAGMVLDPLLGGAGVAWYGLVLFGLAALVDRSIQSAPRS